MEPKSFILGKDEMPSWFLEGCKLGLVKLIHDPEDGSLVGANIKNPTSNSKCLVGDTVMKMRTGINCVSAKINKVKREEKA